MKMTTDLSVGRVRYLFDYDPVPGNLIRRVSTRNGAKVGSAGCKQATGYLVSHIDGKRYYVHRIIWLHVYGEWPRGYIDHVDCDPGNNRLANLRDATPSLNGANGRNRKNNTSGFKGVCWSRSEQKWMANIRVHRRKIFLGYFDDPSVAHAAYCEAAKRYFGEFARAA